MSHHPLGSREGNIPHGNHRDRSNVKAACSSQTGNDHSDCTKKLADVKSAPFTKPADDSSGESARNRRRENAYHRKRNSDRSLAPRVAINRVERPDHEDFVRDVGEKLQRGELPQFGVRPEQDERADRIGAAQREFFAMFLSQRFRHKQKSVKPVRQAESGRNPERQTRTDIPKWTADTRSENEAQTKRDAYHPEGAGAFLFRNDISDIGHGRRNARGSNAGNNAADK